MRSDFKKLDSFTLETLKNHLIRNFLRNGRLRVKGYLKKAYLDIHGIPMICPEHIPEIINEVSVGKFHDTRCERVVKILKSAGIENIVENANSSKHSSDY